MASRQDLLAIGETFEFKLMAMLRYSMPNAVILHDLQLQSNYLGKDTQIDLVVVDKSGVFVIEAKNWKHWIKGDYNDSKWNGLTSDRRTITVFSPFEQNFLHIRTLRNAIRTKGVEPIEFHNIVVLPDGVDIYSNCREVVNLSRLPLVINSLKNVRDTVNVKQYANLIRGVTHKWSTKRW